MSVFNPDDVLFDFSPGSGWRPRVGQSPDFSRSSTKTRRNRHGILETVDSGYPARQWVQDHNGFWLPSARLEAARTNSLTRSEEFDHADWTPTATVTADDAVAPDGSTTADKAEDDDGTGFENLRQIVSVSDDSLDRTVSLFVKKQASFSNTMELKVAYTAGSTVEYSLQVNPATGAFDTSRKSSPTDADVESVNDDWWRVWMAGPNNSTGNTNLQIDIFPAINASGADGTATATTGSIHIWGAQLEGVSGGASFPSSYIKTTSSTVTRAADDLSFPIGFGFQALSIYLKRIRRSRTTSGAHILQLGVAQTQALEITNTAANVDMRDIGGGVGGLSYTEPSAGEIHEIALAVDSDFSFTAESSVEGGAVESLGPNTDITDISLGDSPTLEIPALSGSGGIEEVLDILAVQIAPGVKTLDECRALAGTG